MIKLIFMIFLFMYPVFFVRQESFHSHFKWDSICSRAYCVGDLAQLMMANFIKLSYCVFRHGNSN